jgi:hypothetical protein
MDLTSAAWFDYGEFKCQFNCNANPACLSFVGRKGQIPPTTISNSSSASTHTYLHNHLTPHMLREICGD